MDVKAFFQQNCGKWFSQRTHHHLADSQSESQKSNLLIDLLETNDPAIIQLCESYSIDPALAICGLQITVDDSIETGKPAKRSATLLVPIANANDPASGKLLRAIANSTDSQLIGRYVLGDDEALTLITESESLYAEERLWFASPNLRLRTNVLKQADGFSTASFCSEIRMGVAPASAQ